MTVYIGTSCSAETANAIREAFCLGLKPYYGKFAPSNIKFFLQKNGRTSVYIMDKTIYRNCDEDVFRTVKTIIVKNIGVNEKYIDITLNYSALMPNFNPVKSSPMVFKKSDDANLKSQGAPSETSSSPAGRSDEFDYEKLSKHYISEEPRYTFDQVILPDSVREQILEAVGTIQAEPKVFDEWGLRNIIPNASSAMNFYGDPGTGKTMAAEAIAHKLGKKILRATYADIESKFHGEGPKMVKAIFRAAERDDAVLFIDESDSLLSKRLTDVPDGSAQAINSMRSQLLISLEQFKGIVIFATNLVINYDKAFLSRLISIKFTTPDLEARKSIWYQHLKGKGLNIPLADDVNIDELAEKYDEFCGREIKNTVKDACVTVVISGRDIVCQADLIKASEKTKVESEKVLNADDHTKAKLTDKQQEALKNAMQKNIDSAKAIEKSDL